MPPISALPPHLAVPNHNQQPQYRTPTPQSVPPYPPLNNAPPMNSYGNGIPSSSSSAPPNPLYNTHNSNPSPYGYPQSGAGGAVGGVGIPETLASIPDDQKAMIMRVISMTPEQIALLPPQERASIMQLVRIFQTFGGRLCCMSCMLMTTSSHYVPLYDFMFNLMMYCAYPSRITEGNPWTPWLTVSIYKSCSARVFLRLSVLSVSLLPHAPSINHFSIACTLP